MLTREGRDILAASKQRGWVTEPDAKKLFRLSGLPVPRFAVAADAEKILEKAKEIGYPLVAKVVSERILHKSDVGGVVVGVKNDLELRAVISRFSGFEGYGATLIEEMAGGAELIVGAKSDPQFGPVVLLGIGGTGVEVYQDIAIRMAPLLASDVPAMIRTLKGRSLLEGYRGAPAVNLSALSDLLVMFSKLVMDMATEIESIDLNPVMCTPETCVIADARIITKNQA
jgi:acetate---CoA ligase (ADP-forming) subunit beta